MQEKKKDLENIMTVIHDAQRTMGEAGLDQWQDGYPSEEVILGDIRKGESRIWERGRKDPRNRDAFLPRRI